MSGRDAWIAVIIAAIATVPFLYLIIELSNRYPQQGMADYTEEILGKYAGKALILLLALFFLFSSATAIRDYSDLINLFILPSTPLVVIVAITVAMVSYAVKQGIENLGRITFILLFPSSLLFLLGLLASSQNIEPSFILPLMEQGFGRVAHGIIIQFAYFGLIVTAGFLLHLTTDRSLKKSLLIPFSGAAIATLAVSVFLALRFQETKIENFVYKLFMLYRQINSAQLNNIDALFVFLWTFTFLATVTLFHYITVVSIAKLTNTNSYRPYVLPVGVIIASLGIFMFENRAEFTYFAKDIFPYLSILVASGIPVSLYIFSIAKKT